MYRFRSEDNNKELYTDLTINKILFSKCVHVKDFKIMQGINFSYQNNTCENNFICLSATLIGLIHSIDLNKTWHEDTLILEELFILILLPVY